ncbi:carbamoyltransferase [Pendulispora rubella]|uniref:Carbamoyltransferase n=1 Tax=Pendulispora rubella TaxID=2741070 RepID=A0ABZ2L713_9BACT
MNVLGISSFYHDSAVCLLRDGALICGIEEEKLSRVKHDKRFPILALRFCLDRAKIDIQDIDVVAFYENPEKKMSRQIWMGLREGASPEMRKKMLRGLDPGRELRHIREVAGYDGPVDFVDHHQAHAASSYFFSGFSESAIMTFDGVGEWATATYGYAKDHAIDLFEEVHFPHSIGLLYSTVTSYLGFDVNDGEYKVMGLAPYGTPRYVDRIQDLVSLGEGGQFRLNLEYFDFLDGEQMYSQRFVDHFGRSARTPESELEEFHNDMARSLQVVLEDILLQKAKYVHQRTGSDHLCMAGGVALNCVANAHVLRKGPFRELFVQPAASDAGGALGAAALVHARRTGARPTGERMKEIYLGPSSSTSEIAVLLRSTGLRALDFTSNLDALLNAVVDRLVAGKVIGWFSGPTEFGPRALGARSILGDPRDPEMRDRINALVKMREAFRPFAPAVLENEAARHFDINHPSPFMLETCQVISKLELPAVTHVDGSARVQTVDLGQGGRFAQLLQRFNERTQCPILLNTSFNVRGEPIVCSPEDALLCFARSRIDALVLEDFVIDRDVLPPHWELAAEHIPIKRGRAVSHKVYEMF